MISHKFVSGFFFIKNYFPNTLADREHSIAYKLYEVRFETWTTNEDMERKLEVFQAWCFWRMISQLDGKKNN